MQSGAQLPGEAGTPDAASGAQQRGEPSGVPPPEYGGQLGEVGASEGRGATHAAESAECAASSKSGAQHGGSAESADVRRSAWSA